MNKNYIEYLKSNEWKEIKSLVLKRDGNKCIKCGSSNNLQIHHTTYVNIFNEAENLDDLITLCGRCHMEEHNIEVNNNDSFVLKVSNEFIMQESKMKPNEYIMFLNIMRLIQSSKLKNHYCIEKENILGLFHKNTYKKSNMDNIINNMILNQKDVIISEIIYNGDRIIFEIDINNFNKYFNIESNYSLIDIKDFIGLVGIKSIKLMSLINRFSKTGWMKIKEDDIRTLLNKPYHSVKTKTLTRDIKLIISRLDGKFKIKSFNITKVDNENIYEFTFNKFKNTIGGAK